ncbi:MAG TPA: hypothetical protein VND91_12730, partial [Candidatus Saccharimonadia bacterium]|nr:hypothetical protein [Candidatus Saccharimonadia bacterium]
MARLLVLLLLLAPFAAADAQSVARGQQLYSQWCTACHAADPRADSPRVASNNPDVLDFAITSRSDMR